MFRIFFLSIVWPRLAWPTWDWEAAGQRAPSWLLITPIATCSFLVGHHGPVIPFHYERLSPGWLSVNSPLCSNRYIDVSYQWYRVTHPRMDKNWRLPRSIPEAYTPTRAIDYNIYIYMALTPTIESTWVLYILSTALFVLINESIKYNGLHPATLILSILIFHKLNLLFNVYFVYIQKKQEA